MKVDDQLIKEVGTFGVITDVVTHASASTVTMGHGYEGVMYNTLRGQRVEFTIIAKERNGQKRTEGGDMFEVILQLSVEKQIAVKDCGNGSYTFWLTPNKAGHYEMFVLLMGHHVQGSPFTLFVEEWNLARISSGNDDVRVQLSEDKLTACNIYNATYGRSKSLNQRQDRRVWYGLSGRSHIHSVREPLFVVGSLPFSNGKHMWKAKLCSFSNGFRFGIIDTSRISDGKQVKAGSWWVWNAYLKPVPLPVPWPLSVPLPGPNLPVPLPVDLPVAWDPPMSPVDTQINCKNNDIIEMYLDCDNGTLMMYNQRTNQSDIKDNIVRGVAPVFLLMTDGDKVSLQVKD